MARRYCIRSSARAAGGSVAATPGCVISAASRACALRSAVAEPRATQHRRDQLVAVPLVHRSSAAGRRLATVHLAVVAAEWLRGGALDGLST